MKRELEQVWFHDRLPHVGGWFAGVQYLGPEVFPGQWKGTLDTDVREIALKIRIGGAWKTYRVPLEYVKLYRGLPTKAEPDAPSES